MVMKAKIIGKGIDDVQRPCPSCQVMHDTRTAICNGCQLKVANICMNRTSTVDIGFAEMMRTVGSEKRERVFRRLVSGFQPASQKLTDQKRELQSNIKLLKQENQRMKTCLNKFKFKNKSKIPRRKVITRAVQTEEQFIGQEELNLDSTMPSKGQAQERIGSRSESAKLLKFLKHPYLQQRLGSLTQIAIESSTKANRHAKFMQINGILCDGFEIALSVASYAETLNHKSQLVSMIHHEQNSQHKLLIIIGSKSAFVQQS